MVGFPSVKQKSNKAIKRPPTRNGPKVALMDGPGSTGAQSIISTHTPSRPSTMAKRAAENQLTKDGVEDPGSGEVRSGSVSGLNACLSSCPLNRTTSSRPARAAQRPSKADREFRSEQINLHCFSNAITVSGVCRNARAWVEHHLELPR